jgi:hypothetical protein
MNRKSTSSILGWAFLSAFAFGCSSATDESSAPASEDEWVVVPPGKADNYYSNVSAEFEVNGTIDVTFDNPDDALDETLRQDKIDRRLTAVALFLTTYMTNKLERFFNNLDYGGFSAMARNYTVASEDVEEVGSGHLRVSFSIDVAGPQNMMSAIPRLEDAPAGEMQFDLAIPDGFEASPNEVPRGQIRNFDPDSYTGELEHIRCTIDQEKMAQDAYPQINSMIEDGVLDVTLYFGHDYNDPRSDLQEAKEAFGELDWRMGFELPVASFDDLTYDSGAFVRTMMANGREIRVEVRIFHSDMFVDNRKLGHDTALAELTARDVFFYNGHAGPFYGFYLSDDKPNDVTYTELAALDLPAKQQIFVAQGCQTYSQYADMLYANPAKSEDNLDVFTTVNFSYGVGTMKLLRNMLNIDSGGTYTPVTYGKMVRDLNAEYWNDMKEVFYGVHGIDGNPQVHPFAALDRLGQGCEAVEDCGDDAGNVCVVPVNGESKVCGAVALAGAACPEGTNLVPLAAGDTIDRYACLP